MRAFLVEKVTATENSLRAALRNFGLKMGAVTRPNWDARARELAAGQDALEQIVEAMLRVRSLLLAGASSLRCCSPGCAKFGHRHQHGGGEHHMGHAQENVFLDPDYRDACARPEG